MSCTATIKCPACGKENRELNSGQAAPCSRCQADLEPLVRIQIATGQLQAKLFQELTAKQPAQAQATLKQMQSLSPAVAKHPTQGLFERGSK